MMAELVRQMAALDHEGAWPAAHILAVLLETDFGEFGHGDQEGLLSLIQQMPLVAPVEQTIRDISGYRDRSHRPGAEAGVEVATARKTQVQREIGSGDDVLPVLTPGLQRNVRGCVGDLHVSLPRR